MSVHEPEANIGSFPTVPFQWDALTGYDAALSPARGDANWPAALIGVAALLALRAASGPPSGEPAVAVVARGEADVDVWQYQGRNFMP